MTDERIQELIDLKPELEKRRDGLLVMLSPERKEVYSEPQKTNFRRKLVEIETIIAAIEAVNGGPVSVCENCGGIGEVPTFENGEAICPTCGGSGESITAYRRLRALAASPSPPKVDEGMVASFMTVDEINKAMEAFKVLYLIEKRLTVFDNDGKQIIKQIDEIGRLARAALSALEQKP